MSATNVASSLYSGVTHEGAAARKITPEQELKRTVMTCLLWEDGFYESGKSVVERITSLVARISPEAVAEIAKDARDKSFLRHIPLLLVRELARHKEARKVVRSTLAHVIQRPDELTEFLALYWSSGKTPLAASVKKGLADAFGKFSAYQLAKYDNQEKPIKLRDVLFLTHAKPKDAQQAEVWKKLVNKTLEPPDTWEVALSASKGEDKKNVWERLLKENKIGPFALIRNLRNFSQAGVDRSLVSSAMAQANPEKILPFRFLAALRHAPTFASELEGMMLRNLEGQPKLPGRTILLIDVSGSMTGNISAKSDLRRVDAATALAVLLREICESVGVATFATHTKEVPAYRGLGLVDAVMKQFGGSTELGDAVVWANTQQYDRLIVITDEQASGSRRIMGSVKHTSIPGPKNLGYMINVASNQNGVGYGPWVHIDGWSERILDFMRELEAQ